MAAVGIAGHRELVRELFQPRRDYHPTSGYRMLMALLRRYGEPKVAEMFLLREADQGRNLFELS